MALAPAPADLSVYIHWPFCLAKCPYCDFNSHVRARVDQERWRAALLTELRTEAAALPDRRVTSVFLGGGTPSLMRPGTVAALLAAIRDAWPETRDPEVTLEANPTSVETGRLRAFREAGVNRLSLGVQSLRDDALRFLGRGHSAREARAAVEAAAGIFERFSFDLIYARPDQDPDEWRAELREALDLAGGHLSLYQLTVEPDTGFAAATARGDFMVPAADPAAVLYEVTQEMMEAACLPAYEVSNHAAPGAACRHNLSVWRGEDYLGLGPGAHGRITGARGRHATTRIRAPEAWLRQVERDGHGSRAAEPVNDAAEREERVMLGLRLAEGIPLALLDGAPARRLGPLVEAGYLACREDRVRATRQGWLCLNAVTGALLA